MSECGKYAKKSTQNNYMCMKRGIGVGSHLKLPPGYHPDDSENEIYCGTQLLKRENPSPYDCLKKGIELGKKIQYGKKQYKMRENFSTFFDYEYKSSIYTLIIALIIGLVTFGLFLSINIYWMWAIIISAAASIIFLYYCNCSF